VPVGKNEKAFDKLFVSLFKGLEERRGVPALPVVALR